jgi:hypothetical protein
VPTVGVPSFVVASVVVVVGMACERLAVRSAVTIGILRWWTVRSGVAPALGLPDAVGVLGRQVLITEGKRARPDRRGYLPPVFSG